ncbi:MAG TPA: hypothetical protein VGH40_14045 [Roseiarcus sp.]
MTKGGADVDDRAAIARTHPLQRRHDAVDLAEVSDFGGALELFRRQSADGREDGRHRDIRPDVDRPQFLFDPVGGGLDRLRIGDVSRDCERSHAIALDLLGRGLQTTRIA